MRLKKTLLAFFFLLLFIPNTLFSQDRFHFSEAALKERYQEIAVLYANQADPDLIKRKADEVLKQLRFEDNKEMYIKFAFFKAIGSSNVDTTIFYLERAYKYMKETQSIEWQLSCANELAFKYNYGKNFHPRGEAILLESLDAATKINLTSGYIGDLYMSIGRLYRDKGEFEQAMNYLNSAVEEYNKVNDTVGIPFVMLSSGKLALDMKDYKQALKLANESFEYSAGMNRSDDVYYGSVFQLFMVYAAMGNEYELEKYFDKIEEYIIDKKAIPNDLLLVKGIKAYIKKRYDEALDYFTRLENGLDQQQSNIENYYEYGYVYHFKTLQKLNRLEEAIAFAEKGIQIKPIINSSSASKNLKKALADLYIQSNNLEKGYELVSTMLDDQDKNNSLRIHRLMAKFQTEAGMAQLRLELKRMVDLLEENWGGGKIFLAIIIFLLIVIGVLLFILRNIYYKNAKDKLQEKLDNGKFQVFAERTKRLNNEKEKVEMALSHMSKLKDETKQEADRQTRTLAGMHHELKTPLNAIINSADILKCRIKAEENKGMLDVVWAESLKMRRIVKNVLDYAAIESGKKKINREPIDLHKILSAVRSSLILNVQKRRNQLNLEYSDDLPQYISFYNNELEQVLTNLLSNAAKYTEDGIITLKAYCSKSKMLNDGIDLRIDVTDTGIGMDEDMLGRLFSMHSNKYSNSVKYDSNGLGLAITQKMVHVMGGEISVASKLGEGTTFSLSFKEVEITHQPYEEEKETNIPDVRFQGQNVLVVIRSSALAQRLITQLEHVNLNVKVVNDYKRVFEIIDLFQFDALLIDTEFTIFKGTDMGKVIKRHYKDEHIRVFGFRAKEPEVMDYDELHYYSGVFTNDVSMYEFTQELCKYLPYDLVGKSAQDAEDKKVSVAEEWAEEFEEVFKPQWSIIQHGNKINDVSKFLDALKDFATLHTNVYLNNFISLLDGALENFDVVRIPTILQSFPELIQNIKRK